MSLSNDKQADIIDALTLHPDIWTIFYTLIMFILTLGLAIYILQSSNLMKLIPLIPKPRFRLAFVSFE